MSINNTNGYFMSKELKEIILEFELPTDKILNSNNIAGMHHMKKSNIASYLRNFGAVKGLEVHPDKIRANNKFNTIIYIADFIKKKSSLTKKLKKMKKSDTEIALNIVSLSEEYNINDYSLSQHDVSYIFDKFKAILIVFPPTKRRLDPANLSPTLKPLIDGLTDASYWEDDDFNHLLDTSFRYGGVSGIKNTYILKLILREIDDEWSVMD